MGGGSQVLFSLPFPPSDWVHRTGGCTPCRLSPPLLLTALLSSLSPFPRWAGTGAIEWSRSELLLER